MYKIRKKVIIISVYAVVLVLFAVLSMILVPDSLTDRSVSILVGVPAVILIILLINGDVIRGSLRNYLRRQVFDKSETHYLVDFINKLRFCYSLDDFYKAIADSLEIIADCSVLFVDCEKNYILYNSPNRISSSIKVRDKLALNFPVTWGNGTYFIDDSLGIVSSYKVARGFFISSDKQHFYVFCRYTKLFDLDIYDQLFEEFTRFQSRAKTIANLSEISGLTKEWQQLADTQRSFLPQTMPNIAGLKLAAYFRPLVNVSGDYYSVLPVDKHKTLLMLGDVSGKGLPAALIMGLVMNTVKIIENKEDLVNVIHEVDKAIKGMSLQDKYTVLFLGIIDTQKMTIRYINASMSDPIVLSRSPDGYRIKPLSSNASLVGIIDMGDIHVAEQRLFRGDTILMATDGVSEVMDDNGVELGDTEIYKQTLQTGAAKQPQQFVDDIVNLVMEYNGDKKLHDDVTMMVAKVGY
ncbi:MAG: SpoIIE family protein phosphatase [Treponema sp.]|nr:SpoIIE family protein phosphatase [Treponema sp.]